MIDRPALDQRCRFETQRLSVESWKNILSKPKGLEFLTRKIIMMLSKKVTKTLPQEWARIDSTEKAVKWIRDRDDEGHVFTIMSVETRDVVGLLFLAEIELDARERSALRLGFFFSEKYWGRGMASELIKGLVDWCIVDGEVASITGGVGVGNVASSRVLGKNGFVISSAETSEGVKFFERRFE